MAFEGLSDRLQSAMGTVSGKGKITEADLKQMMREVRLALLEADVNFKVVKKFVKTVNERALGANVLESLSPAQQVVKIVNEELTELMGGEQAPFNFSPKPPTVVMMVGLQGAGKTTTAGKLAKFMHKNEHKRPLLIAADVYRPAAIDQLQTLGEQLNYPVFSMGTDADPVEIARQGIERAKIDGRDLVIIDTAGRLHVDDQLMAELQNIKEVANPQEILLVVDSMTGQDAVNVAETFNERLDISGVVLTKLDGDTRGGAALSIRSVTGKPIKFTGQGEKLEDFEIFYPERMASRILGMGDIMTLIEKAQQDFDEEKAQEMADKIKANTFDFNDFLDQLDQVNKMGPLEDIIKMIPGLNKMAGLDQLKVDPKDTARMKAIVLSMTNEERENPEILSQQRRKRIAKGSARPLAEVNRLIKQFNESKKMMNQLSNGNMRGLENMMGAMGQMGGRQDKMAQLAMQKMARKQRNNKLKKLKKKRKK
ncbi:signal recognition particle subunit FFH/SRP54 (srp54) [Granulicatella balaenopterae]|uniref:Signal recognition particle protein n=1 Tax=Granulicatella balaenopterae TaxID=137733 RepID=A0A1H9GZN1_9LACT|nr:signal recognition particle protein [Granulicatella balaenopterae]SEQ55530.1 signal recognition particle subunit FFH/SRP54 (srp54) [Granulicatella balaenopterae]